MPAQIKPKSFETRWNFFFYLGWMRLMFMCILCAWMLGCFHSLISIQTFQRALTVLVDSCAVSKSAPSLASRNLAEFGGSCWKAMLRVWSHTCISSGWLPCGVYVCPLQADGCGGGPVRTKEVGKLLYALATQLKSQIRAHMPLITRTIALRKITSELQLKGMYWDLGLGLKVIYDPFSERQLWSVTQVTRRDKSITYIYDLVPKGVQEKRTEVLENKVDRM